MRRMLVAGWLLLLVSPTLAATLTTRIAQLASAQAATGASANTWMPSGNLQSVWVCGTGTGTIAFAVELSPNGGTTWGAVYDGATAVALTAPGCIALPAPSQGLLRTNLTTCTGCSFTATVLAGPES